MIGKLETDFGVRTLEATQDVMTAALANLPILLHLALPHQQ